MIKKREKVKSAIFLQVRLKSERLNEKAFLKLKRKSILQHIVERFLSIKKNINYIAILTPVEDREKISKHLSKYLNNIIVFGGDEDNVLKRFYDANKKIDADVIIRATADNPLVSIYHLVKALNFHIRLNNDYTIFKDLPLGLGVEVLSSFALNEAFKSSKEIYQKEHVTPYIREHKERFKISYLEVEKFYRHPDWRLTVDEEKDFELMKIIYDNLYKGKPISVKEVILFLKKNPELILINKSVKQKIVVPI